jgi:hypothetical protein
MLHGNKIVKGLDLIRISLGGAIFGGAPSNVLGNHTSLGPSLQRDLICAAAGFALFLWILIDEDRKEKRARAEQSKKLDTAALSTENHGRSTATAGHPPHEHRPPSGVVTPVLAGVGLDQTPCGPKEGHPCGSKARGQ